ncbi:MAG: capsular polysaccharide biosynthesis protein, partial [Pseudomonadota bacterium]
MTGLAPVRRRLSAAGLSAVGGWGRRPSTQAPRAAGARAGLPFIAFEDGFFRSMDPGAPEAPASYVLDRTGIYYDASGPSDLEAQVRARAAAPAAAAAAAAPALHAMRALGLSKYNRFADAA